MLLRDDTLLGDSVVSTVSDAFSIAADTGTAEAKTSDLVKSAPIHSRRENARVSGAIEFSRPALRNYTGGFVAGALHVLDVGAGIHMRFPRGAGFAAQLEHA